MVLLPEEAEMTLAELRQVAARQQHQIEAQQQLLVAKEQRLKFLKQQEARHHGLTEQQIDTACLQKLREKVEAQEMKLRHLRALRGQVEQQKTHNGNLGIELDSIRALFNEKEKELSLAVAKVEELTRQLDEIRSGSKRKNCINSTLNSELEKLKRELLYRTKLAEQQNNLVSEQRGIIAQRQQDISHLDKKIGELTQRLHRKRLVNQQLASQIHNASVSKHNLPIPNRVCVHPLVNIATVEPIQREPQELEHSQDDMAAKLHLMHQGDLSEFCQSKNDPKYQTLPYNTKFTLKGKKHLDDVFLPSEIEASKSSSSMTSLSPQIPIPSSKVSHNMCNFAPRPFTVSTPVTRVVSHQPFFLKETNSSTNSVDFPELFVSKQCEKQNEGKEVEHLETQAINKVEEQVKFLHVDNPNIEASPKSQSDILLSVTCNSHSTKPVIPPKPTFPLKPVPPPRQMSLSTTKEDEERSDINIALSILQNSSEKDTSNYRERLLYYHCMPRYLTQKTAHREVPSGVSKLVTYFPKATGNVSDQDSNDIIKPMECSDLPDSSKRKPSPVLFPIKPKPLTIRKTPGLEPPKLKVQQVLNTCAHRKTTEQNISTVKHSTVVVKSVQKEPCDVNLLAIEDISVTEESHTCKDEAQINAENNSVVDDIVLPSNPTGEKSELSLDEWEREQKENQDNVWTVDDQDSLEEKSDSTESSECLPIIELAEDETKEKEELMHQSAALRRVKKGNLKTEGSIRSPRRVSFDPLALLLDAALEGELELVKKTANEVPNASTANDEGITALHNAICAGHFEIVTFLVEFGCDVNAQDSDGWTPLHCAASCNNLPMVKFLVERGACIFATTLSDQETAAEKCEEDEEGFDGCSEYLYSLQENLGVINDGIVYAVYGYESQNADELCFKDSDLLTVLRKGDELESEWWWSRLVDREGYVPRNLLGLYPRVAAGNE